MAQARCEIRHSNQISSAANNVIIRLPHLPVP